MSFKVTEWSSRDEVKKYTPNSIIKGVGEGSRGSLHTNFVLNVSDFFLYILPYCDNDWQESNFDHPKGRLLFHSSSSFSYSNKIQ